jgi:hypothetical protein
VGHEFADVMAVTMDAATTLVQDAHPNQFSIGTTSLYSFDGARIHQSATKREGKCFSQAKAGMDSDGLQHLPVTLPRYA